MEYPKINSLYMREGRNEDGTFDRSMKEHPLMLGKHAAEEFGAIKTWRVDEKIDGTNIRIHFNNDLKIKGRTENSNIPGILMEYLQKTFTFEKMKNLFPLNENGGYQNVMLFGEGYGPKIQACGSKYRSDHSFILFDVVINKWWLKKEDVKGIAQLLEIDTVPDLGVMTEEEVVNYVKSMPLSKISKEPLEIEGVVCRSEPLMFFRNGNPIMWKLKCKDIKQREEHDRNNSNAN